MSDRGKDAHPTDPAILTPRLRLRPVREADLDALLALYTHPEVAPWIGEHDRAKLEAEHARWRASDLPWWAVEERAWERGIDEVVAVVKPDHAASRRVLEKAGLSLVGPREAYGEPMLLYAARRAGASSASHR